MFDDWILTLYNIFFTSFGVMAIGLFEQDIPSKWATSVPGCKLFMTGQKNQEFNLSLMLAWSIEALFAAAFLFLFSFYYAANLVNADGIAISVYDTGNVCMTCVIFVVSQSFAVCVSI